APVAGGDRAGRGGSARSREAGRGGGEHGVAVARLHRDVHTGRVERGRRARVPRADLPHPVAGLERELEDGRGLAGGWGQGRERDGAAVAGGGEAGGGEAPGGEAERQAARAPGRGAGASSSG